MPRRAGAAPLPSAAAPPPAPRADAAATEFAIVTHSELRDLTLSYLSENGLQARAAGTNAVVVDTPAHKIDVGMTYFPLPPEGQTAAIAAAMLKSGDEIKVSLGVGTLATIPFHSTGELDYGEAEKTLLMNYCDPRALLYRSVRGPECRESLGGRKGGGVWVLYRATRNPESYTLHPLGLGDGEIYPTAQSLMSKVEFY